MQVTQLVNEFYTSNTYVLSVERSTDVWLVDCGDYASQVRSVLNGRAIKGVLLTHTHSDHIYGIKDVLADFPDVRIYTNDFGRISLRDSRLNLSKYHTEVPDLEIECQENTVVVGEGTVIELYEGVSAQVLFTPGHDNSCLSYIIEDKIFTGDSFIPGEKVRAIFPNSNKVVAEESYNRLATLSKNYTIYPGHGQRKRK